MERISLALSLVRPAKWYVLAWSGIAGYRPVIDTLSGKAMQSDFVPKVSVAVWLIGSLLILLATGLLIGATKLQNSPIAFQKNADEMENWRKKGISLMWQWQLPTQYPNAQKEANDWRIDIENRLKAKYGDRAAGAFNHLDVVAYHGIGATQATPYIDHILRTANLNTVIEQVLHGQYRPRNSKPF